MAINRSTADGRILHSRIVDDDAIRKLEKEMKIRNLKSSKNIWTISMLTFLAVALSMIFSTLYMNDSIQKEEDAELRRAEYKQLGQDLADASDYLTAEVRSFAVSGDIQHLYNYWEEIFVTRNRDNAIAAFEQNHPPKKEQQCLEEAKKYSDALIELEIRSMKLKLLSQGKTVEDFQEGSTLRKYVAYVLEHDISEHEDSISEDMPVDVMENQSVKILYDAKYEGYKDKIMNPIQSFQEQMNSRLDQEVEARKGETGIATVLQIVLAMVSIASIGILLALMKRLYIRPLEQYTTEIKKDSRIEPQGAMELVVFAEAFNEMLGKVYQELVHRKEAEEQMKEAMEEAKLANEAKSIFLAQMSHELRTPLNAVNGYNYLLEQTGLETNQQNYLQSIRYSSNGLLELINQILDFSKIEAGQLELEQIPFSLRELLKEVQAIFRPKAEEKKLEFQVQMDAGIPEVLEGDPLRLRQVLVNLISNALKFTETGGIYVTVKLEQLKRMIEERKSCCGIEQKCTIYFAVKDTGIGVSQDAKNKIFQPFAQSDASVTRKYGGTGLGLPISSEIVAASGDKTHTLHLESTPKEGSTFYFSMDFPISEKTLPQNVENSDQIPDCGGQKILLVDDREVNRMVLAEILRQCNLSVQTAESGAAAITRAKETCDFALVFMDIRMPEMDGYETTRRIHQISGYEKLPVIALTADAVPDIADKAREAGMAECLLKPVRPKQLHELLMEYLHAFWSAKSDTEQSQINVGSNALTEQTDTGKRQGERIYFNEAECLEQMGGNRCTLYEILRRFIRLHEKDDSKIEHYICQGQYKKAEELVHQLKGVTGSLCCTPLYCCCSQFQQELQKENAKRLPEFLILWKETWKELKRESEAKTMMAAIKGIPKDGNNGHPIRILAQIAELSQNHDTEAVFIFEANQTMLKAALETEEYEQLSQAVYTYAFSDIQKYTAHILKK